MISHKRFSFNVGDVDEQSKIDESSTNNSLQKQRRASQNYLPEQWTERIVVTNNIYCNDMNHLLFIFLPCLELIYSLLSDAQAPKAR